MLTISSLKCQNDFDLFILGIIPHSPLLLVIKNGSVSFNDPIKTVKSYLFELKEKDKVTSSFLQDSYQEDKEVLEAAEEILSEDSEDSLQKIK